MENVLEILTQMRYFMGSELYFTAESSRKGTEERTRCAAEALGRGF